MMIQYYLLAVTLWEFIQGHVLKATIVAYLVLNNDMLID